jgi:hypothetical protein
LVAPLIAEAAHEVAHLEVHRYDGTRHRGFVMNTFALSMRRPPSVLRRALMRPGVLVLVASPVGESDIFVGWLAAVPTANRIVCAYTRFDLRRKPGEESPFRVASSLAIAAGVRFDRPVPCTFWSRAARRVARRPGNPYRLFHAPEVVLA